MTTFFLVYLKTLSQLHRLYSITFGKTGNDVEGGSYDLLKVKGK
jgi:hypothetical protein